MWYWIVMAVLVIGCIALLSGTFFSIKKNKAEEAAKQQAAYTPKHLAGTDTAQPGSLAQTGDRAGLIGETFVIGGTVLVAAGVFLDQKKRREQM